MKRLALILMMLSSPAFAQETRTMFANGAVTIANLKAPQTIVLTNADKKSATIDFEGDTVKYSGDLPVDEAAKVNSGRFSVIFERKFNFDNISSVGDGIWPSRVFDLCCQKHIGALDARNVLSGYLASDSGISGGSPKEDSRYSKNASECCDPEREEPRRVFRYPQRLGLMSLGAFCIGLMIGGAAIFWLGRK